MTNLVANGNFATGSFTDWTLGGNDSNASSPQIFIDTNGEGGSTYAAGLGSMGSDGTLSQSIATTAGQTYTLSFWLQNEASGDNDFTAMWDGQPVLALTNASAFGYTEYTFTVTALGSTSTLGFSAANGPSQWNLDNISLTAGSSTAASAAPAISTGAANSNQSVTLTGTAPDGATVTVWDGATALGAATASSTGAWSFTTPDLSLGSYAFSATDATSAGSSAASSPFDVMVTTLPAPPAISTGVENSNQSVTMTGTAPGGATVTVSTLTTSDGVTTALGTTTASSTGAWSFTTAALSAGSYDFTATDTTSAGTSSASNPFVVGVSSTNPDPLTYYVSSEIGSDNNAGTSATAPLASLQAAEDLVQPGDTVEVMNGTYTGNAPGGGDVLDITTSGTASAPITFEAAPGQTPVINSSGGWNAINIEASYIVVEGFTVVGDAANYTSAQALAGYSSGNANLDGNGIAVIGSSAGGTGAAIPNHITIENNTVYDEPGGGIDTQGADYVQILNNVVYDNAHWSAYGNSGISINVSANSDTNAGVHDIISGNLVFGNAQEVPTTGGSTITDGEGIILDTNPGFTGEILVENNTVYNSGSSGIESFLTDNAVITGNTVYGNNTENVQAASNAQIFINQSTNDTVTNNTTTAPSSTPPAAPVISTGAENSNDSVTLTGTAPDGSTVTMSDGGATALGTATASSTGAWSFTTADLSAGSYAFTATDTTSAGTSAASNAFDVTVTSSSPPPAAPVISTGVANSNESVTLTGTAPDGSTVTVSDGGATALGTATASSTGAWSFTTADLSSGFYAFTATDTTSAGTSAASSAFDVTVTSSSPPPSGSNLVANGNFATGNFTDWTLGGNDATTSSGAVQIFIDTDAEGSSTHAAGLGSMGADGTLSQTIATTAGQTYTLSFWLQNEGSGGNDFAAISNGQTLLSLSNAAKFGYTEYTYTVTATGNTMTLEFSAANGPSQWDLDNISLTANSTPPADPTVIQTDSSSFGSTSLTEVGNQYYLYNSSGSGPELKQGGADVVAGEFGGWVPIGAVQTASGYNVAWEIPGANEYTVWTTDSNGNFLSYIGIVSGTSTALESFAPIFGQDLNGGGVTGTPTVIQTDTSTFGSTSLTQVWYDYFLDNSSGPGPELKQNGADVVAGQFGGWVPIGAVQTASGYDVAWELPGTNKYTVWTTDSKGNFLSYIGVVSGTSTALESFAPIFGQDLNGGGVTGTPTVIQTDTSTFGSTSLTHVWYDYFLDNSSGSGPELKQNGADVVAGQFGGWVPIGAVQTASGYDVAWEIPGANEYTVWTTDSKGNFLSYIGVVSGTSTTLESYESIFNQDLNGDGVIGLYAAPGTTLQISAPLADPSGSATIGAGATLELAVADSGSVTFASSTGTLILESPSTFSGEIFNFTGNGKLSGSDQIDLKGINYNSVRDSYANGVLTVTNGTNTDKLDFNGSYTLANFDFASDGSGGTIVYDPPAPTSNALVPTSSGQTVTASEPPTGGSATIGTGAALELGSACSEAVTFSGPTGTLVLGSSSTSGGQSSNFTGTVSGFGAQDVIDLPSIAFDAQTTLGYLAASNQTGGTLSLTDGAQSAKIALLGNYMASSFAVASDNHGGTMVTEASQASNQSLLTNPQHT